MLAATAPVAAPKASPEDQAQYDHLVDSGNELGSKFASINGSQFTPIPHSALLVTSSPARAATADNVAKMQQVTNPQTSTDGTKTATDTQTKAAETPTDSNESAVSTIQDPGLRTQYKGALDSLDSQISSAQSNIDAIQQRSANDPAAMAITGGIKQKYDQMIQIMKDKNKQFLGKVGTSVAAFGGLGPMSQDFLNNEQQQADQRVSTLQSQEDAAIMKAQVAYQTQNYKDLNTAMDSYNKANKSKLDALNKLLSETDKRVTQAQAQQRVEMAQQKQAVTLDISKSSNLGASIAKNIADSGIKDKKQIDSYIANMAEQYGISNPDILSSAVEKARQTLEKTNASLSNTKDSIANRDQRTNIAVNKANGGGRAPKFTVSTAISKVTPQMDSVKGEDGYIDPAKWVAARDNWMALGGTAASFKSNFIHYLNPASYTKAGYKAPAAASTASPYQTN